MDTQTPPLMILPGMNSGAYLFSGAEKKLGREVVLLDPPGVGKTPLPLPFSVKAYARQVAQEIDRRGFDRVDVLGHSLGGFAAQELAKLLGERVHRLVLVSTSFGQPASTRDMVGLAKATEMSFWQVMKQVEDSPDQGMAWFFGEKFVREKPKDYGDFLAARAKHLPVKAVSLAHITAGGTFSSAGWVGMLELPVLIIHGTQDLMVSLESGRELAARLPNGRLVELYGVGHFPMLEHEKFYEYIQRFLDGEVMGDGLEKVGLPWWRRMAHKFMNRL